MFFPPRTCLTADIEVRQSALMGFALAFKKKKKKNYLPAGGMS